MRRRKQGQPASPLVTRPRVGEIFDFEINDEWPYYNTSENYNVTIRDPQNITYNYTAPVAVTPHYIRYTRPSFTDAWCTLGPDDIQHN